MNYWARNLLLRILLFYSTDQNCILMQLNKQLNKQLNAELSKVSVY